MLAQLPRQKGGKLGDIRVVVDFGGCDLRTILSVDTVDPNASTDITDPSATADNTISLQMQISSSNVNTIKDTLTRLEN